MAEGRRRVVLSALADPTLKRPRITRQSKQPKYGQLLIGFASAISRLYIRIQQNTVPSLTVLTFQTTIIGLEEV